MNADISKSIDLSLINFQQVAIDLYKLHTDATNRGLNQCAKWAAELLYAFPKKYTSQKIFLENKDLTSLTEFPEDEWTSYLMAKSYFTLQEYDRAAFFTREAKHPTIHFFHMYSRYLSTEKKKLDNSLDSVTPINFSKDENLRLLRADLEREHYMKTMDGYLLYLYGIVLRKLQLNTQAVAILCQALEAEPLQWSAWLELAALVSDHDMLHSLKLPNHWMRLFFMASVYLELQFNEEALKIYQQLKSAGFQHSTYLKCQEAIAYHNMRELDQAIDGFRQLTKVDPYRLDKMDIYSNLLYVKELRVELSHLAHRTCEIDKYRVETCCIIGNFYSLRNQHEKAALYFQKALKLNPNYLSAWTLMGHEFNEMKNTPAAVQAYRQALDVNRKDYRAWYGLGQTYELIKMPFYSLTYYKRAHQLRPNDSRMIVALGEVYEKLEKLQEAKKCYWRAQAVGDIEQTALLKLAKLYDRLGEKEEAAIAYLDYLKGTDQKGLADKTEQGNAYKYLANYYLNAGKMDEAYKYAQKCLGCPETREEGKSIVKQLEPKKDDTSPMDVTMGGEGEPSDIDYGDQNSNTTSSGMNFTFSS